MFEILGTIFSSVFAGGATGIIGLIAQRIADHKNKQLDLQSQKMRQEYDILRRETDSKTSVKEIEGKTQIAQIESQTEQDKADATVLTASYALEPTRYSSQTAPQSKILIILDVFRGCVRPFLTIYLCAVTTAIYLQAYGILQKNSLTSEQALELNKKIIDTILYLTTTCVLWWFGTRNKGLK